MNTVISLDYPDPDIIRVNNIYYMLTTTMHFMPGGEILRSLDLTNWEHECFVYDVLADDFSRDLNSSNNIYGQGMWAGSIRYHEGEFYVLFSTNENQTTYLYRANTTKDKWKKTTLDGFYHDPSLLFDKQKAYIIYGNQSIKIKEVQFDLCDSGTDGLDKVIIQENNPILGYEGSHAYKINNKYYIFLIHSLADEWRRVQACYVSDSIEGPYVGKDILNSDRGYCNQGIAQGGIVDSIDGDWFSVLFQDHGAVGRLPVILPFTWDNGFPSFNLDINHDFKKDNYVGHNLVGDGNFKKKYNTPFELAPYWQFNHAPNQSFFKLNNELGSYEIEISSLSNNITEAQNTLTQRMIFPSSCASVTIDGSKLKDGDSAGLGALQGAYAFIALTKENGQYYIDYRHKEIASKEFNVSRNENYDGRLKKRIKINKSTVTFKICAEFNLMVDRVKFCYNSDGEFKDFGDWHNLFFKGDHFTGSRYALFTYGTKNIGGIGKFTNFIYDIGEFNV